MVILYSRGEKCESNHWRGTIEEFQGTDLWKTCESQATQLRTLDLMLPCTHLPTVQPTSYILLSFHCQIFRSGKCEECMVCHNSIRNITNSCFIFYAISISLINCANFINLVALLFFSILNMSCFVF